MSNIKIREYFMVRMFFLIYCFLICILNCGIVVSDSSQVSDIISVDEIEFKQSSDNAYHAKQLALNKTMHKAFFEALQDAFPTVNSKNYNFSNMQISDCVYDYSVEDEKFSDKIYICKVSYRFIRKNLENLLRNFGAINALKEIEDTENKYIVMYTEDYFGNFALISSLKPKLLKITKKIAIFSIPKSMINNFKALSLGYYILKISSSSDVKQQY